jgi:hypothetical protein
VAVLLWLSSGADTDSLAYNTQHLLLMASGPMLIGAYQIGMATKRLIHRT